MGLRHRQQSLPQSHQETRAGRTVGLLPVMVWTSRAGRTYRRSVPRYTSLVTSAVSLHTVISIAMEPAGSLRLRNLTRANPVYRHVWTNHDMTLRSLLPARRSAEKEYWGIIPGWHEVYSIGQNACIFFSTPSLLPDTKRTLTLNSPLRPWNLSFCKLTSS